MVERKPSSPPNNIYKGSISLLDEILANQSKVLTPSRFLKINKDGSLEEDVEKLKSYMEKKNMKKLKSDEKPSAKTKGKDQAANLGLDVQTSPKDHQDINKMPHTSKDSEITTTSSLTNNNKYSTNNIPPLMGPKKSRWEPRDESPSRNGNDNNYSNTASQHSSSRKSTNHHQNHHHHRQSPLIANTPNTLLNHTDLISPSPVRPQFLHPLPNMSQIPSSSNNAPTQFQPQQFLANNSMLQNLMAAAGLQMPSTSSSSSSNPLSMNFPPAILAALASLQNSGGNANGGGGGGLLPAPMGMGGNNIFDILLQPPPAPTPGMPNPQAILNSIASGGMVNEELVKLFMQQQNMFNCQPPQSLLFNPTPGNNQSMHMQNPSRPLFNPVLLPPPPPSSSNANNNTSGAVPLNSLVNLMPPSLLNLSNGDLNNNSNKDNNNGEDRTHMHFLHPPPPPPTQQSLMRMMMPGEPNSLQNEKHLSTSIDDSDMDMDMDIDEEDGGGKSGGTYLINVSTTHLKKEPQKSHSTGGEVRSEEVKQADAAMKSALKPYFAKRMISKEEYKEIMKKGVKKLKDSGGSLKSSKVDKFVKQYVDAMIAKRKSK